MKKLPADFAFLVDMYSDPYFPDFLVDKLKYTINEVVQFIEEGNYTTEEIQQKLDATVQKMNELESDFDENDSEIETVARESIAETIAEILAYFDVKIEIEEAIRERNW